MGSSVMVELARVIELEALLCLYAATYNRTPEDWDSVITPENATPEERARLCRSWFLMVILDEERNEKWILQFLKPHPIRFT